MTTYNSYIKNTTKALINFYKKLNLEADGEICPKTKCYFNIIKAHSNIVKTRPSNVNCGNVNATAIGPTHA